MPAPTILPYPYIDIWGKIKKFAIKAGKELIEKVLVLYYCLQDEDTPAWAKAVIVGALTYFILTWDLMPDPILVDDLYVLTAAMIEVAFCIKEEHRIRAKEKLAEWFE